MKIAEIEKFEIDLNAYQTKINGVNIYQIIRFKYLHMVNPEVPNIYENYEKSTIYKVGENSILVANDKEDEHLKLFGLHKQEQVDFVYEELPEENELTIPKELIDLQYELKIPILSLYEKECRNVPVVDQYKSYLLKNNIEKVYMTNQRINFYMLAAAQMLGIEVIEVTNELRRYNYELLGENLHHPDKVYLVKSDRYEVIFPTEFVRNKLKTIRKENNIFLNGEDIAGNGDIYNDLVLSKKNIDCNGKKYIYAKILNLDNMEDITFSLKQTTDDILIPIFQEGATLYSANSFVFEVNDFDEQLKLEYKGKPVKFSTNYSAYARNVFLHDIYVYKNGVFYYISRGNDMHIYSVDKSDECNISIVEEEKLKVKKYLFIVEEHNNYIQRFYILSATQVFINKFARNIARNRTVNFLIRGLLKQRIKERVDINTKHIIKKGDIKNICSIQM